MKWVITSVSGTDDMIQSNDGKGTGNHPIDRADELPYKFKLFDDDGELYYEGKSNDRNSEAAFEPLDWATHYAGCTEIQYQQDNGNWETL